jgi:integrase
MPVYRDKRGRYSVDFRAQGRRIFRRCPKGCTAAQARLYEAKLRADLWQQRLGRGPSVSLASALQNHIEKSIKGTRSEGRAESSVYRLMDYAQDRTIEQAPEAAAAFVAAMRGQYSVASINRSLAALRRSCSLAYLAGWTQQPVHQRITMLPGEVKRTVWLTTAEVRKLVDAAKYRRTKDLILLLAYTGLRLGELLSLKKADVRGGIIHVETGKTREMRSIPVHPAIRDAVKRLPLEGARRNIQQSFDWARKKAGMKHVRIHDLRHTFGSWLAQNGVQLPTIMELMGHKSAATAKRYLHLDASAKKKAIGTLT